VASRQSGESFVPRVNESTGQRVNGSTIISEQGSDDASVAESVLASLGMTSNSRTIVHFTASHIVSNTSHHPQAHALKIRNTPQLKTTTPKSNTRCLETQTPAPPLVHLVPPVPPTPRTQWKAGDKIAKYRSHSIYLQFVSNSVDTGQQL
jgi:hypothetical protein